jgi:hypothetical protein
MLKLTTATEEASSKKFVLRKGYQIRKLKLSAKRSDRGVWERGRLIAG